MKVKMYSYILMIIFCSSAFSMAMTPLDLCPGIFGDPYVMRIEDPIAPSAIDDLCKAQLPDIEKRVSELSQNFNWPDHVSFAAEVVYSPGVPFAAMNFTWPDNKPLIIVGPKLFKLSPHGRDAGLSHEIGHIQQYYENPHHFKFIKYLCKENSYMTKIAMLMYGLITVPYFIILQKIRYRMLTPFLLVYGSQSFGKYLSRNLEFDADKRSAKSMKSAHGMIEAIEERIKEQEQPKKCTSPIENFIEQYFINDHPRGEDRITKLRQIVKHDE